MTGPLAPDRAASDASYLLSGYPRAGSPDLLRSRT